MTSSHRHAPYTSLPERRGRNQGRKTRPRGETGDDQRGRISLPGRFGQNTRRLSDGGHVDPLPADRRRHQGDHRQRGPRGPRHGPRGSVVRL